MSEPAALVGLGVLLLFGFATGWLATSASSLRTALAYPAIFGVALYVVQSNAVGSTLGWVLAISLYFLIPLAVGYLLGALLACWRPASTSPLRTAPIAVFGIDVHGTPRVRSRSRRRCHPSHAAERSCASWSS